MKNMDMKELRLDFLKEEEMETIKMTKFPYKILIADDDVEVHSITKMMLKEFHFEEHPLIFLDAFSGKEAKELLKEHQDVAVLFLDVVMETNQAGLEVVEYLRNDLENQLVRVILRTGQPGEAPEEHVIRAYDINDYRLKTEMTMKRLYTTMYSVLRNYRDLMKLERHKKGLERIIKTSADLFRHNTVDEFLESILFQLSNFYQDSPEMLYVHGNESTDGFVTISQQDEPRIVAATGKYKPYIGQPIWSVSELSNINDAIKSNDEVGTEVKFLGNGFLIRNNGKNHFNNYIFIEGNKDVYDFELIKLFLSNYSVALDNYILSNMISSTQKEIIIMLGEVVEKHFDETGGHVRRISDMMYQFALKVHFSYAEAEMVKVASTMHDVGKIAIPDAILKKKGRLTMEEFEQVQEHSRIGYKILSKSNLDILKLAAELALNHHERFDGTGYPNGMMGRVIPLSSRMLAIVDVFDAMTHKRVYKEAAPMEEAISYLRDQKGRHFDPELVEVFIKNLEEITREEPSKIL